MEKDKDEGNGRGGSDKIPGCSDTASKVESEADDLIGTNYFGLGNPDRELISYFKPGM